MQQRVGRSLAALLCVQLCAYQEAKWERLFSGTLVSWKITVEMRFSQIVALLDSVLEEAQKEENEDEVVRMEHILQAVCMFVWPDK